MALTVSNKEIDELFDNESIEGIKVAIRNLIDDAQLRVIDYILNAQRIKERGQKLKVKDSKIDTVTRVVVVDHTNKGRGRIFDKKINNVEFSLQDNNTTLKIFIN